MSSISKIALSQSEYDLLAEKDPETLYFVADDSSLDSFSYPAKKITNCPNCGAVLSSDGHCEYCGTYVY